MNITIILPAVHVTSKRQPRGDESPQPTTPFPPISITPSPTPFSEGTSYNPDDYKDLIDEYNREIAGNHLTKSRAEIVKRQAAYDDIEIVRSDPGTTPGSKSKSVSPPAAVGKGGVGNSLPCPYCSSSESIKSSDTSLRSAPMEKVTASVIHAKSVARKISGTERRGTAQTTPSTDRTTESPSSVDTVNTVIQSKAYDILGELKEQQQQQQQSQNQLDDKFDIGSTLDDSFESIDSAQELDIGEEFQEEQNENSRDSKNSPVLNKSFSNDAPPTPTPSPSLATKTSPSPLLSPSPPAMMHMQHDFMMGPEERNLDSLYEEDEENEDEGVGILDEVVPPTDLDATTEERNESLQQEEEQETKEEIKAHENLLVEDKPSETPQAVQEESPAIEENISATNDIQEAPEPKNPKPTEEVDTAVIPEVTASTEESIEKPNINATVEGDTEETVQQDEEQEKETEKEIHVDKDVPVTEQQTGNDEVQIIVTQDDMPPANIFDSDEEEGKQLEESNKEATEKAEQVSLSNAKSTVESTTSDNNGETQSETQPQESAAEGNEENSQQAEKADAQELQTDNKDNRESRRKHSDSSKTSDFYEEEIITHEIVQEDAMKNSNSSYYDSHQHDTFSYNMEKIEDSFSRHAYQEHSVTEKGFEQTYEMSEKSYYEKDFENESGYEDFDRSFQDNNGHFDNSHQYHHHLLDRNGVVRNAGMMGEPKIHRQHTFADMPTKKPISIKKQKTEDFSSTATTAAIPFLKKKSKPYPDPRKPAAYPQRLNKTTLARQALAREKRRIYVEERIQNFMRNTKSIQTPYGSLDRSFSIDNKTHNHNKILNSSSFSLSKIAGDGRSKYDKLHHLSTTTLHRPNHDSLTQISYRKSKIQSPQSLPDISIIDYYMAPSRGLFTSTPMTSTKTKLSSSHKSHHLSSSMSSIRSPTIGVAEVSVVSGGGGERGGTSQRSGVVIDSIPEETSDFWKAIASEEGYFYTFRVRQTGPVQMLDKAVQTQSGPMNFSKEFHSSSVPRKRVPPFNKSSTITLPLIDDRDKILREIAETVQLRHDAELRRAELIQRANDLQTLIKEKRDKINRRHEFWHKKYIEESSMTRPLEAACNSLRAELNTVHRRLLAHLEGRDLPLRLRDGPSKKANYKIMAARLQHEIKELQQKAKAAKLRLESEIKLKEQAEREVRELRNDLAHKKVIMSLARSQIAALPSVHPRGYDPLGY